MAVTVSKGHLTFFPCRNRDEVDMEARLRFIRRRVSELGACNVITVAAEQS